MSNMPDHDGHPHHDHSAAVHFGWNVPVTLVLHLVLLSVAMGLVMPYAFAAKRAGSPRQLPAQAVAGGAIIAGALFGHFTGIEWYNPWFSDVASLYCIGCAVMSFLLVLRPTRYVWLTRFHSVIDSGHTIAMALQPVVSWVFVLLSCITLMQFCKGSHLGQCLAHFIMGSAFIAYGVILILMLYCGEHFLVRINKSQEFCDSLVITIWGIVNTFTEHRWGEPWNHGDVQHTSMGIVWWATGLVGLLLSWDRVRSVPQRNLVPAAVIAVTGYAMMTHVQILQISTDVHYMFGVMLMFAAITRVIEISFVLKDEPHRGLSPRTFQFLPPLLLIESGMIFMGATEETMAFLDSQAIMAAPYILLITSVAAVLAFAGVYVIQSYVVMSNSEGSERGSELPYKHSDTHELHPFLNQRDEFDVE